MSHRGPAVPRHLFYFLLLAARLVAAEPVLDTVAQVRALSPAEAARGLPVRLAEATVIFFARRFNSLYVSDATGCAYVSSQGPAMAALRAMPLTPGSRVRVDGTSAPGDFTPHITQQRIELLGSGTLPAPRRVGEAELFSPALDSQWVEVPALVTGVEIDGDSFSLLVEVYGRKFKAPIPQDEHSTERAAALMQRRVRLQGVAGTIFNAERQMTGRDFLIPSFDQLIPTDTPATATNPPLLPVNELLRCDTTEQTPVRVSGIVTQTDSNDFYLRDASGSMRVRSVAKDALAPGDRVTAEGFAAIAPYRPTLRAWKVVVTGHTTPPVPRPFDFLMEKLPHFHDELVTLDAEILARRDGTNEVVLQCRTGDQFFEASLPPGATLPPDLAPGDHAKLTGICELTTTHTLPLQWCIDGFRLHLPKSGGVVILHHAPWWTLRRLLAILGMVGTVALLALAWVALLRHRVKTQTAIIVNQREREAVQGERTRIARELHDTVEQELASLSMQLGNTTVHIRQAPSEVPPQVCNSIEIARKMLHHCRAEARASIHDLRSIELELRGLPGALQDLLPGVAAECGANLQIHISGEPLPLAGIAETHILRIAQEGVANAAHHAAASQITVTLDYAPDTVTLSVRDDGCGFDPATPPPNGHFGLRGIRERANKMQAALDVASAPGQGTSVQVVVPHSPPLP
jgi:signal transduction histidine kinase